MNRIEYTETPKQERLTSLGKNQAVEDAQGELFVKTGDLDTKGLFVCLHLPDFTWQSIHGQDCVAPVDLTITVHRI